MNIEIPESVVEAALSAKLPNGELVRDTIRSPFDMTIMQAAIQAALAELLEPVGWVGTGRPCRGGTTPITFTHNPDDAETFRKGGWWTVEQVFRIRGPQ